MNLFNMNLFNMLLGLFILTAVDADQPNSLLDITPGVSQLKSMVQMVFGDIKGAEQTQETYLQDGLGPSQARSLYFLVTGEPAKALAVQKQFLTNAEAMVDSLPGVGHVKGLAHILAGDEKHGWDAIKSATSATGSVIGAVVGGPAGAVAGHVLTDTAISGVDKLINGDNSHAHGVIDYVANIGNLSVGEHVDAISGLLLDAAGGKSANKFSAKSNSKSSAKSNSISSAKSNSISSAKSNEKTAVQRSEPQSRDSEIVRQPLLTTIDKAAAEHSDINGRSSLKERTESRDSEIVRQPQVTGKTATAEQPVQTAPKGRQEARTGDSIRPTVEEQETIRHQADYNFRSPIEEINAERFREFGRFLRNDPTYKGMELYRQKPASKFIHPDRRYNMKAMADTSIPKLTYLTKSQQDLLGLDEFRLVNTLKDETKNCFGCSVAGALKKDVKTLHEDLNIFSKEAYSKELGANPAKYLDECEEAVLLEYKSSPDLRGLNKLNEYLKEIEPAHADPDTKSILTMYDDDGVYSGHSYVAEYKFLENSATPEMVLVDFQQPAYLAANVPNPLRFINYVDSASYSTFKVHTITTSKPLGIKTVDLYTKPIDEMVRRKASRKQARQDLKKDPEYVVKLAKRRHNSYVMNRDKIKIAAENANTLLKSHESGLSAPQVSQDVSKSTLTAPQAVPGPSQPSLDTPNHQ